MMKEPIMDHAAHLPTNQRTKQRKLIKFFSLLLTLIVISVIGLTSNRLTTEKQTKLAVGDKKETTRAVLSHTTQAPSIFLADKQNGYGGGGLIALSSLDEPSVQVGSYTLSGDAQIAVFEANEDALLDYLLHNKENKQTKKSPDTSKFQHVATLKTRIASGYNSSSRILLPITKETGIWYLKITLGDTTEEGYVVRSNFGVLATEGDNEIIYWGQEFHSRQSIADGTLTVYSLLDTKKEIANAAFTNEGIAKTPIAADADIAIVHHSNDVAVVPLNLQYLNSSYNYQSFRPKDRIMEYFTFTDRPLYKPGDTVYFKSVIRDDDDARYTIPTGLVRAKIYRDYDEKDTVFEKNYPVSANGTIDGTFTLPQNTPTGYYQLQLSVPSSQENAYNTQSAISFQVEYYRKPQQSIDVTIPNTEFIAGDNAVFTLEGSLFSGQPLTNAKINYTVYSGDFYQYDYFSRTQDLLQDDYRYGYWSSDKLIASSAVLNNQGEAAIDLSTKLPLGKTRNQVFSIEATYDNGSGSPSFARKNVLVFAGEYDIFRKDYSGYSSAVGQELTVPLILVPHRKTSVADISLTATITRTTWIPYQEPGKKYLSYKEEQEKLPPVATKTDQSGNTVVRFTPKKAGSYQITISGKDTRGNTITKEFYAWVSEYDQPFYTSSQDNDLVIQTDKAKYAPDQTAKLTISSTIVNRDVFVAFERAAVHRYKVVRLQGKTATLDMPLAITDIPNIFAKVSSFSPTGLDANTVNMFVSADSKELVVKLTPNQKTYGPGDTVVVNVQTSDIGGNPLAAETAVWAVDKALFELVDQSPLKIFDAFWHERSDDTQATHSLSGITVLSAEQGGCFAKGTKVLMADGSTKNIEDIKKGDSVLTRKNQQDTKLVSANVTGLHEATVGGYLIINGDLRVTPNHILLVNDLWQEASKIQQGDALRDKDNKKVVVTSVAWQAGKFAVYNLEIATYHTYFADGIWVHNQKGEGSRSVFKDSAYWNPNVRTDTNGRAQVRFKLPDNLTTWVLASVGSTVDTRVGQSTQEIVVTKDVIVQPISPSILRIGDKAKLSALVNNFTSKDHTFTIDLHFDSGTVKSATKTAILIKANEQQHIFWETLAEKENEQAKLTFSAWADDDPKTADSIIQQIPVRQFGFTQKQGESGIGPKNFSVQLAKDSDPKKSSVTLSLAPTIVGVLPDAMQYLVQYPYGCVEQTTSRFVPAVIAKANSDLFKDALKDRNVDDIIKKGIARLASLQQSDGGWTWWFSGRSSPFITAYVVDYVLQAKQLGIPVDDTILSRARVYLEQDTYYNAETNQYNQAFSPDELIAKTYGLSLLGSEKGKRKLTDFATTPDLVSLALMTNVRNGDTNPATNGLNALLAMAKTQGDSLFWEHGKNLYFGSYDASTAFAIRAILEVKGDRAIAAKAARYLIQQRKREYWSNTFATAQVIQALVSLAKTGNELTPNYSYTVQLDGRTIKQGIFTSPTQKDTITIPNALLKSSGATISVKQSGEGQLYSTLVASEFLTDRQAKAKSSGMTLTRSYSNDKGASYALAVGDMVTVALTVSGLKTTDNYAVIADELPAGLIPINQAFKNEQYGQQNTYSFDTGVSDYEITENGMVLSLYQVAPGTRTYSYKARVITEGTFIAPPAIVSLMYSPVVTGRTDVVSVTTVKASDTPLQTVSEPVNKGVSDKGGVLVVVVLFLLVVFVLFLLKRRLHKKSNDSLPDQPQQPQEPQTQ